MTSKRRLRVLKNDNHGSTRGVRILPPRLGRPAPYGVQWAERVWDPITQRERRVRKSKFFETTEARDAQAKELRDARRAGLLRAMNRREVDEWLAFKAAIGETPWQNVVAAWLHAGRAEGSIAAARSVADQVKDYLARQKQRVDDGALSANWHGHQRHKLRLFAETFGGRALNAVSSSDVERWLDSRGLVAPGTWNSYRKIVAALYADAVERRITSENPVERISQKTIVSEEVGILTVEEIARLLHAARTLRDDRGHLRFAIGLRRMALEVFAGVRFSSACRLTAEDVQVAGHTIGIRHTSRSIKTRRRQYVEGYPRVLAAWLAIAPDDALLTPRLYERLKCALFAAAGVPHPHNCLRHSFATYHLAARKNPGLTALLLCHRNQLKLWDCYKGNARAEEGRRWEKLTPPEVARIAGRPPADAPPPKPDPHQSESVEPAG